MRLELSALWYGQRQWQLKNGIHKGYLNPSNSNIYIQDSPDWSLYTGLKPFSEQKNSMIFKDTLPMFQGLHSVKKRALSLSFLVLPQHEQFHPEGLSVFAAFRHLRIRAQLFKGRLALNLELNFTWLFSNDSLGG